jgi:pimeloyl-ACP methyl ester carboxylesterase
MRLATTDHGSGHRRIALVHGLGGSGALWGSLVDRMLRAADVTVTTVDLRGHGETGRAGDYGVQAFADDLAETLPAGLDVVVGHSLGGAVLERAVARLRPHRALYLDPGFSLALPTTGARGRLFWAVAPVSLTIGALRQRRKTRGRPTQTSEDAALTAAAGAAFDKSMAVGVFREIAFHPTAIAPPAVPSVIILSDDSPAVLAGDAPAAFERAGWEIRRVSGIGHDFWLEDPDRTWAAISDLVVG